MTRYLLLAACILFAGYAQAERWEYAELIYVAFHLEKDPIGVGFKYTFTSPSASGSGYAPPEAALGGNRKAVEELFLKLGWGKPESAGPMYVLNHAVSLGWEVVSANKFRSAYGTAMWPGWERYYLLKRKIVEGP